MIRPYNILTKEIDGYSLVVWLNDAEDEPRVLRRAAEAGAFNQTLEGLDADESPVSLRVKILERVANDVSAFLGHEVSLQWKQVGFTWASVSP